MQSVTKKITKLNLYPLAHKHKLYTSHIIIYTKKNQRSHIFPYTQPENEKSFYFYQSHRFLAHNQNSSTNKYK